MTWGGPLIAPTLLFAMALLADVFDAVVRSDRTWAPWLFFALLAGMFFAAAVVWMW